MLNKEDFKDFEAMTEKTKTFHPVNSSLSQVNKSYFKEAYSDFILINIPLQLYKKTSLKSSQYLDALALFSLITSEIFQVTHRYRYQFVREVMTDTWSIKEIIQFAILGIPKGMKKCSSYFYCF